MSEDEFDEIVSMRIALESMRRGEAKVAAALIIADIEAGMGHIRTAAFGNAQSGTSDEAASPSKRQILPRDLSRFFRKAGHPLL